MIPILYESTETAFTSNGLGRLRDTIEAHVTEERNGIYEFDFSYPVGGHNYDEIQLGRIVVVEHDDTGDLQPFDIVSVSRPIDGVVTFHCVHVSYRLRGIVNYSSQKTTLYDAFVTLAHSLPANPFNFESDFEATGYIAAFDGTPHSVRSLLGGMEGSILDTYGGEYEWDGWTVRLWRNRGQLRDFAIRYGVNLVDYNEEIDYSETYTAVMPFYTTDLGVQILGAVSSGQPGLGGREVVVPFDANDKIDPDSAVPKNTQALNLAQKHLAQAQPYLPAQTITVDFIRLQDSPEYASLAPLLTCRLCDTIKVIMPMYGTEGTFKIVKTVWDVLLERYTEMELGKLSTTLSEALGIDAGGSSSTGVTGMTDFVTEHGSNNAGWYWRKWNSGKCEAWGNFQFTGITVTTASAGTYYGTGGNKNLSLPSGLFTSVDCAEVTNGSGTHASGVYPYAIGSLSASTVQVVFRAFASSSDASCPAFVKVYGNWR